MSKWTVYTAQTYKWDTDDVERFGVFATVWTDSGKQDSQLREQTDTMEAAVTRAAQLQREYDALRKGMAGDRA